MNIRESIEISFDAIKSNKLRSFLTLLGIIIGVTAIIAMQSLIGGFQRNLERELRVLGANVFQVQKYPPIQLGGRDREKYRHRKNITRKEAEAIRKYASAVSLVGPEVWMWGATIKYKDRKTPPLVQLAGGTPEFQPNNGYFVEEGRFITHFDVDHSRHVAVLGLDVVEELFPFESPIGKEIRIGAQRFEVVGVLEEQGKSFGRSKDNIVIIPISTFEKIYGSRRSINITVQAKSAELFETAINQVIAILRVVRKVPPGEPNDFEIFSSETLVETFNNLTRTARTVAIIIVSIALLVAGIGIMNIMLVSVTERTREIGIRKAVGAKRRDILIQFLLEAVTFSEVGGVIGVILGIGIGQFVRLITPLPAIVPVWVVILALGFCSLVGVFFGIYPAIKAARLDPIVALRYE